MKWFNLLKNKCPQCNKDFLKGLKTATLNSTEMVPFMKDDLLMTHPCGFKITERRYKEIVSDMTIKKINNTTDYEPTH